MASNEALRETSAMELGAKQRAADEAEERHLAHERRLLSEVDRERMATHQANAELGKEQKGRTADMAVARSAQEAAKQALQDEQSAHRDAVPPGRARDMPPWSSWQPCASAPPARNNVRPISPPSQLKRHQEQSEREISQLRESQATTAAAPRQLEAREQQGDKPARSMKTLKSEGK